MLHKRILLKYISVAVCFVLLKVSVNSTVVFVVVVVFCLKVYSEYRAHLAQDATSSRQKNVCDCPLPLFLSHVRTLYWFSQLPKYYNGNDLVLILFVVVVVVVVVVIVVLQAHSDHFDLVSRRMGFIPLPLASVVSTFIITPTSLSFAVNINWCLDLCTDASSGNTVYQIPWHTGDMLNGHGLFLVSRYFGWMEE